MYENPWFIALVTIPLTYLFAPVLNVLLDWLRSRRGRLTGTYLALTKDRKGELLAELVNCWQVGNRLRGRIRAVCRAAMSEGQVAEPSRESGRYKFQGRTSGPLVSLLYWERKRSQNGGTITFTSAISGEFYDGVWSGVGTSERIIYGPCTWIRVRRRDFPKDDLNTFVKSLNAAMAVTPNRWRFKAVQRQATKYHFTELLPPEHPRMRRYLAMQSKLRKGETKHSD